MGEGNNSKTKTSTQRFTYVRAEKYVNWQRIFQNSISPKWVSIRNSPGYFNGYELKPCKVSYSYIRAGILLSIQAAVTILLEVGTDPLILDVNTEAENLCLPEKWARAESTEQFAYQKLLTLTRRWSSVLLFIWKACPGLKYIGNWFRQVSTSTPDNLRTHCWTQSILL